MFSNKIYLFSRTEPLFRPPPLFRPLPSSQIIFFCCVKCFIGMPLHELQRCLQHLFPPDPPICPAPFTGQRNSNRSLVLSWADWNDVTNAILFVKHRFCSVWPEKVTFHDIHDLRDVYARGTGTGAPYCGHILHTEKHAVHTVTCQESVEWFRVRPHT